MTAVDALNDIAGITPRVPGALRGPADPEAFRIERRRQRWYYDPLPTCPVATSTTAEWPAISTVKRAWPSTFRKRWDDGKVYDLDHLRIAKWADERFAVLAELESDERIPMLATAAERDLNRAAERGTGVHSIIETLCAGHDVDPANVKPQHAPYLDIARKLVADLRIDLRYAEVVGINRHMGIGCTIDAIPAVLDGELVVIDWKTRGADSSHGAYEGEAAQLGVAATCDYARTRRVDQARLIRGVPRRPGRRSRGGHRPQSLLGHDSHRQGARTTQHRKADSRRR